MQRETCGVMTIMSKVAGNRVLRKQNLEDKNIPIYKGRHQAQGKECLGQGGGDKPSEELRIPLRS